MEISDGSVLRWCAGHDRAKYDWYIRGRDCNVIIIATPENKVGKYHYCPKCLPLAVMAIMENGCE